MPKVFGGGRTAKKPNIPSRMKKPSPKAVAVAPPPMPGPGAMRPPMPFKKGGAVRGGGAAIKGVGRGTVC
jgi:hypothetical protein